MLTLRGLLQPLTERQARGDTAQLDEAMRLAAEADQAGGQDPLLGVAAKALDQP
jgi:hypothetical protein